MKWRRERPRERGESESELDHLLSEFESGSLGKRPLLSSGGILPIGCALFALSAFAACNMIIVWPIVALSIMPVGLIVAFWLNQLTTTARQKKAVERLASFDDMRVVPPLIEILKWP